MAEKEDLSKVEKAVLYKEYKQLCAEEEARHKRREALRHELSRRERVENLERKLAEAKADGGKTGGLL